MAYNGGEIVQGRLLVPFQFRRTPCKALLLEPPGDYLHKVFGRERFGQIVKGPRLHCFHRGRYRAVAGDDNRNDIGIGLADLLEHLHAAHAGHLQIHQGHVRSVPCHQPQALLAVLSHHCPVAFLTQCLTAALANRLFVVNNRYSGFLCCSSNHGFFPAFLRASLTAISSSRMSNPLT